MSLPLPTDKHYKVNTPTVTSENRDGQVVVTNLGQRYHLDQVSAELWEQLQVGTSVGDMLDHVVRVYDGERDVMHAAVHHFLNELENEKLIVVGDHDADELFPAEAFKSLPAANPDKQKFLPPVMKKQL